MVISFLSVCHQNSEKVYGSKEVWPEVDGSLICHYRVFKGDFQFGT